MLFSLMFLLPVLSWQTALLKAYRRALEDDGFREDLERMFRRLLLEAYVEHGRSKQEAKFATTQTDVINDLLQIVEAFESFLRSVGKR